MWGDGLQTRSFCYIDDAVEGVLRLMRSDVREPLNIGSDEMVSMIDMGNMALEFAKKKILLKSDISLDQKVLEEETAKTL